MFFRLVTKQACDRHTDRRADRQNYHSQDRASIAALRDNKLVYLLTSYTQNAVRVCDSLSDTQRTEKEKIILLIGRISSQTDTNPNTITLNLTLSLTYDVW